MARTRALPRRLASMTLAMAGGDGGRHGPLDRVIWSRTRSPGTGGATVDEFFGAAIEEAERGLAEGGIPIGSVLVHRGRILGRGHNRRVQRGSVVLHGEMDALESAGRRSAQVYRECTIYTTLSPCAMCSGTILLYGIPRVVVGENRTFLGEEELLRSRGVTVEVLQDARCQALMAQFIQAQPTLWAEDIGNGDDRIDR